MAEGNKGSTSYTSEKFRYDEGIELYIKRVPVSNQPGKPPINFDKESFFDVGAAVSVYITKIRIDIVDTYTNTITITNEDKVEETETLTSSKESINYCDTRIPSLYHNDSWEKTRWSNFDKALEYFKSEFVNKKFKNSVNLDLVIDQSITNAVIDFEMANWIFTKFKGIVFLKSVEIKTNTIVLPNQQYNNFGVKIYGFDISVMDLCYILSESSIELKFTRITNQSSEANRVSDLTLESNIINISVMEVHGNIKINLNGKLDTEERYQASEVNINTLLFYPKISYKSISKRNLFKIMNFNRVNINYVQIPRNSENSTFLYFVRCTQVNLSNYTNKSISTLRAGSEIYCESISMFNAIDIEIVSEIKNANYNFVSFNKCKDAAEVSISDSKFVNIGVAEFLNEECGVVSFSNLIVSNDNVFLIHDKMIISKFNLYDSKINCIDFKINNIGEIFLNECEITTEKSVSLSSQKTILDDCTITSSEDFYMFLDTDLDITSKQSRLIETAIDCKNFKAESKIGYNKQLKYEDFKLYCNNYEDSNIDKVIANGKVIIQSIKYKFSSAFLKSQTDEFYLRCDDIQNYEDSIVLNTVFSGKITLDVENNSMSKIYMQILGLPLKENETPEQVTGRIIVDGLSTNHDSKSLYLKIDNYFTDIELESNNINNFQAYLSLSGALTFEDGRIFYFGNGKMMFAFDKIDAADLEKCKLVENVTSKPTKSVYKLQYGVIKND